MTKPIRVGLISDTHGLVRDEAVAALKGCRHILHAGDIDTLDVLAELRKLAPVTVVRGNNDRGSWADAIPVYDVVEFGPVSVYLRHDEAELDIDPRAAGFRVMMFGHSHKPRVETRGGVLFVNPGSAGPRRFRLPVAMGELLICGGHVDARIIELSA
ncbi:MAG TPA: metallophosphoesterase family protein [Burkholderiales bacterium]|nr:metallophosphoesterase family protein [Burkholderiales bacterium]